MFNILQAVCDMQLFICSYIKCEHECQGSTPSMQMPVHAERQNPTAVSFMLGSCWHAGSYRHGMQGVVRHLRTRKLLAAARRVTDAAHTEGTVCLARLMKLTDSLTHGYVQVREVKQQATEVQLLVATSQNATKYSTVCACDLRLRITWSSYRCGQVRL